MRKAVFMALVTILFSGFIAATASAQPMLCMQLEHGLTGIGPFVYKLSLADMGNGNYSLVGSSYTTLITNPPTTTRRVISGGAVVMEADKIEVSLRSTDIYNRPDTTAVESLAASDIHILIDGTLNGTFHIVNVHYPVSSDTTSGITTTSHEGTVSLIDCN